jgi:integrase/recombinase XerD
MSSLRRHAEEYLALRRSLGYKLDRPGQLLLDFVRHLEAAGIKTVTIKTAVAWATLPAAAHPSYWTARLSVVRGFAKHLQAVDPATEIPPTNLLVGRSRRATPYLYSDADIAALMTAAKSIPSPLRAFTYETLIGLLAVTGMRVGEAIRLDRNDLDPGEGILTVRASKFGKSREVVLHPSTLEALRSYLDLVDRQFPHRRTPSLFVSVAGTRLIYNNVHFCLHKLVGQAGLEHRAELCRPRPHDLRHSFAVRTLLYWYQQGLDVQARMPLLSTYLGHVDPGSTYWYLFAAPELLELVAQRLEAAQEALP